MTALPPSPDLVADALRAQQRALADLIREGVAPPAGRVAEVLRPLAGAAPRLGVYRHAWRARLAEALASNFPVLHRVLGDEAFEEVAASYRQACPSRHPSIRWFGRSLPEWLDAQRQRDPESLPHASLPDLARMEWAIGTSFDAADAAPLQRTDLAGLPAESWPALRLRRHPSVAIVPLQWAVEPLWRALTDDEAAQAPPPEPMEHALLVWRHELDTRWRALQPDEAGALEGCLRGEAFGDLCERLAADVPDGSGDEVAARAATWLAQWIDAGLLCNVPPDNNEPGGARIPSAG